MKISPIPENSMPAGKQMLHPLKIGYLFQSTGLRFSKSFAVQLHIYHQLRGLQQAGHSVSLLALQGRRVLYTEDLEAIRSSNLMNRHFGELGLSGTTSYKLLESGVRRIQTELHLPYLALFDSHRMYEACCKNLSSHDVIHERYNLMALGGAIGSRRLGIPYVLEVNADMIAEREFHGTPERGFRRRFGVWTTRFCFNTAQQIICVSVQLREHLVRKWKVSADKIVVLPNAADTEVFGRGYDVASIKCQLGLTNEPVVMFVGGFYPFHDLPLLVDSFAKVVQKIPEAKLVLVGDGRTRPKVEQMVTNNGLQRSVIMTGAVEHHRVPEMLAIADVAVAPNILFFRGHGGSPLKLYEYMAAGKAVVATRTGQVAEVIRDGHTGLLVEPGDVKGFANTIGALLADPGKRQRLGQSARQQAIARHSWEHYAERLVKIYTSVISV
jgi:glycosyltransferase involved in cell wall biosynthesis